MRAEDVIRFYQNLGFFAGSGVEDVIQCYVDTWGRQPDGNKPWDDAYLLALFKGEAWSDDPEADVCEDNQVYAETLPEWAAISHGAFAPSEIRERWKSDTGPIMLSFELGHKSISVYPKFHDDWMDLAVLRQINKAIVSSGRQFECAADGNFALVVCVTPQQKQLMKTERCFPFAW